MHLPETVKDICLPCGHTLKVAACATSCSSIHRLLECPRKFLYSHRFNLQPKTRPLFKALTMGKMVHGLLAQLYEKEDSFDKVVGLSYQKTVIPLKLEREKIAEETPTGIYDNDGDRIEEWWDIVHAMVKFFWETHPLDRSRIKVLFTEKTIYAPDIMGHPIGIIDTAFQDTETDYVWVVDHKSTSNKPQDVIPGLAWSMQTRLYPALIEMTLQNKTVPGIIYNILQKPTIKFCKKDKDFQAYVTRCSRQYKEKDYPPMISVPMRCAEWIDNTSGTELLLNQSAYMGTLDLDIKEQEMLGMTYILNLYHCNERSCTSLDGKPCPYLLLCSTDPMGWTSVIQNNFRQDLTRAVPTKEDANTLIIKGDKNGDSKTEHTT